MNRTIRSIIAILLILIITFSAVVIFQNVGKGVKADITEKGLYTLSDGTKSILSKLNQPITLRLYYARTAAMEAPDQIKFFNNYYEFVRSLLEEYKDFGGSKVNLEIIDPRPFSQEEENAMAYGLKRFPITEEENFFFGLVVVTQFGVEKVIPFFSPDRQNFVEYDISYLIDTAITRQKRKIGVLSSLEIMGEDMSGYMAQMKRMQGQQPKEAWGIISQLKEQYEVEEIASDTDKIEGVDVLLVIHPKELSEKTQFAIDQYVLGGGRAIICVDPHAFVDMPPQQMQMQMQMQHNQGSNLDKLLNAWGLDMPDDKFAGDRALAIRQPTRQNQRPEPIIGFLELTDRCFNEETAMTGSVNTVRMLFSGVLKETESAENEGVTVTPLISTTDRGNDWSVSNPFELRMMDPGRLMRRFSEGSEPVYMGYLVTGKLKSAFPDGIKIEVESAEEDGGKGEEPEEGEQADEPKFEQVTGLTESNGESAVTVFADVDFISDMIAYQQSIFGKMAVADNSALLLNAVEDMTGSTDLINIRSRGNFKRPFVVVDEIEAQAEAETAEEEAKINAEIKGFESELQSILANAREGDEEVVGSSILEKKKELELKIRQAQRDLREVKQTRRRRIEKLGNVLRNLNMLAAPAVILIIAVVLGIWRSVRRRHYISQPSRG